MPDAPVLVIVVGLPGTGKTTFSRHLAERMSALHLNTDIIRDAVDMRGQYDAEAKKRVYDLMLLEARRALLQKKVVILDGTFYQESLREAYRQLSFAHRIPLRWIELKASEDVIKQRTDQKRTYSEADFSIYEQVRDHFEPFADERLVLQSDNREALPDMLDQAEAYIASTPG